MSNLIRTRKAHWHLSHAEIIGVEHNPKLLNRKYPYSPEVNFGAPVMNTVMTRPNYRLYLYNEDIGHYEWLLHSCVKFADVGDTVAIMLAKEADQTAWMPVAMINMETDLTISLGTPGLRTQGALWVTKKFPVLQKLASLSFVAGLAALCSPAGPEWFWGAGAAGVVLSRLDKWWMSRLQDRVLWQLRSFYDALIYAKLRHSNFSDS